MELARFRGDATVRRLSAAFGERQTERIGPGSDGPDHWLVALIVGDGALRCISGNRQRPPDWGRFQRSWARGHRISNLPGRRGDNRRMLRIYLDQAKWIDLLKCRVGRADGKKFQEVYDLACHAVERGLASFVLSTAHYYETQARSNPRSRLELGATIADFSRFHAVAPMRVVVPAEIQQALTGRYPVQSARQTACGLQVVGRVVRLRRATAEQRCRATHAGGGQNDPRRSANLRRDPGHHR